MSKSLGGLPLDVMAIEAIGNVTHDDYRATLIPKAEAMMAKGPIRTLYVVGEEFAGSNVRPCGTNRVRFQTPA